MNKICIPPIKSQGIKTKIFPKIIDLIQWNKQGTYIEPFMGTGVVGFNIRPKKGIFCDTNPHIINFYKGIQDDTITPLLVREFLEYEGSQLSNKGQLHYIDVRKRFNEEFNPMDFLFLNRSCFNGMIRFNNSGLFNVPFCKKENRFSKAYITKIVNQIDSIYKIIHDNDYKFINQSYNDTLTSHSFTENDFIYCDPPYIDRHSSYYNQWNEQDEQELFNILSNISCPFILSTWKKSAYRDNMYVDKFWNSFNIKEIEHFYHVGAKEQNRKSITEILVFNFQEQPQIINKIDLLNTHKLSICSNV